jgi:hypothetical protein
MDSKSLIEKYKYYKIQNNLLRKHRIQNKDKFSKIENKMPIKQNKFEYFPIESEKSKAEGHTIYLVTEDSNYNNEIEKNDSPKIEIKTKQYINEPKKGIYSDNNNIIYQRCIEFQINKTKINFYGNWSKFSKNKNKNTKSHLYISENKSYDINSFNNYDKTKVNNNNKNNKFKTFLDNNPININLFNSVNAKITNEDNNNLFSYNKYNFINFSNKSTTYRKKIKLSQNAKINAEINKFNELQQGRNSKEEKGDLKKEEKISLTEAKKKDDIDDNKENKVKNTLSNNNSFQDTYKSLNIGLLNKSINKIYDNIGSLYKSLDFAQNNNIVDDLNN